MSLSYSLKSGIVTPPVLLFLLSIVFTIHWFFASKKTLGVFFQSMMNVIGILMGFALNMYIAFGSIAIFTILILPIH
jgi:hypothetical protein